MFWGENFLGEIDLRYKFCSYIGNQKISNKYLSIQKIRLERKKIIANVPFDIGGGPISKGTLAIIFFLSSLIFWILNFLGKLKQYVFKLNTEVLRLVIIYITCLPDLIFSLLFPSSSYSLPFLITLFAPHPLTLRNNSYEEGQRVWGRELRSVMIRGREYWDEVQRLRGSGYKRGQCKTWFASCLEKNELYQAPLGTF